MKGCKDRSCRCWNGGITLANIWKIFTDLTQWWYIRVNRMSDKACIPLFSLKTQEKNACFFASRERGGHVGGQTDLEKNVLVKQSELSALKFLNNSRVTVSPLKSVQRLIFVGWELRLWLHSLPPLFNLQLEVQIPQLLWPCSRWGWESGVCLWQLGRGTSQPLGQVKAVLPFLGSTQGFLMEAQSGRLKAAVSERSSAGGAALGSVLPRAGSQGEAWALSLRSQSWA